jgi:hypothetical protein
MGLRQQPPVKSAQPDRSRLPVSRQPEVSRLALSVEEQVSGSGGLRLRARAWGRRTSLGARTTPQAEMGASKLAGG